MTVRDGRFGAYVNWGKVNATIPKSIAPDSVSLGQALELIAEREGRPAAPPRGEAKASAKKTAEAKRRRPKLPPPTGADQGEARRPEQTGGQSRRRS